MIYIENLSQAKVLGTTNNGVLNLQNFEKDKAEQLWKKGEPNAEGYFTLENYKVPKVMTATSSTSLELKGSITIKLNHLSFFKISGNFELLHFFKTITTQKPVEIENRDVNN